MPIIRMPANLIMPSQKTNRRNVIRGAAGLGLGIGAAGAFGNAFAQDHNHATPGAGASGGDDIGSDASTESTGDATPAPVNAVTPF
ncbi:MAG TPA: hypothetical protein VGR29_11710, partial [Thermomicrobiales bacterium]|nr:hypothetical protein [Thermomicrobiales bacterium]